MASESQVAPGSTAYVVECQRWDEGNEQWQAMEDRVCNVTAVNANGVTLEISEPTGEYAVSLRTVVRSPDSPQDPNSGQEQTSRAMHVHSSISQLLLTLFLAFVMLMM